MYIHMYMHPYTCANMRATAEVWWPHRTQHLLCVCVCVCVCVCECVCARARVRVRVRVRARKDTCINQK